MRRFLPFRIRRAVSEFLGAEGLRGNEAK